MNYNQPTTEELSRMCAFLKADLLSLEIALRSTGGRNLKEEGGLEVRLGKLGEFLIYREGICIHVVNLDQDVGEAIRGILAGVTFEIMGESYLAKIQDACGFAK